MFNRIINWVSIIFLALAVWLIIKEVRHVGLTTLWTDILQTPWWIYTLAGLFTVFDFLMLAQYDAISLKYVGVKIPYLTILKTAAIGFGISNTAGHSYASGGAIRFLFYGQSGVSRLKILGMIAFETLTFFLGMGGIYLIAIALAPWTHVLDGYAHEKILYISGGVVLAALVGYYLFLVRPQKRFHIDGTEIKAPSVDMSLRQMIIGLTDNFLVFMVFYIVVRYHIDESFITLFVVFIIAQSIALCSQIPGGVGLFAGLVLYLLPHATIEKSGLLAGLVLFRVIYFFIPFLLAGGYLGLQMLQKSYESRHETLQSPKTKR